MLKRMATGGGLAFRAATPPQLTVLKTRVCAPKVQTSNLCSRSCTERERIEKQFKFGKRDAP